MAKVEMFRERILAQMLLVQACRGGEVRIGFNFNGMKSRSFRAGELSIEEMLRITKAFREDDFWQGRIKLVNKDELKLD